jgi:hypothetical protein
MRRRAASARGTRVSRSSAILHTPVTGDPQRTLTQVRFQLIDRERVLGVKEVEPCGDVLTTGSAVGSLGLHEE